MPPRVGGLLPGGTRAGSSSASAPLTPQLEGGSCAPFGSSLDFGEPAGEICIQPRCWGQPQAGGRRGTPGRGRCLLVAVPAPNTGQELPRERARGLRTPRGRPSRGADAAPGGLGSPCPSGAAPRGPGAIGSRGRCRRSPPGPGCNRRAPGPPPSACWCVREPRGALLRGQVPLTASAGYRSAGCQKAWPQPPLPSTSHPSCTPRSGRGGSCSWALPRAPLYPQKHLAPLGSHPKTHGVLLAVGSAPQKWPREGRGAAKSWRCPPGGRELGAGEGSGVWCVQEAVGLVLRGSQARGPPGSVLGACGVCFFTKREPPRESLHSAARDGVGSSGGASGQSCHLLQQENGTLCPLGCFTCVPAAPRADFLGLCHQKEPELALEPVPEPCVRAEHPSRCRAPRQGSPRAPEQEICL